MKDIDNHWLEDCEAFKLRCHICGEKYKRTRHDCTAQLQNSQKNLAEGLEAVRDDLQQMKDETVVNKHGTDDFKTDSRGKPVKDYDKIIAFYEKIYRKLDIEDRLDVRKDINRVF